MVEPGSKSAMVVEGTRKGRIFWHGTLEALADTYGENAVITGYENGDPYEGDQPKRVLMLKRREERKAAKADESNEDAKGSSSNNGQ